MHYHDHRPPLETILFVEDEVLTRLDMSEFLRQSGYRVSEAAHVGEALDALNAKLAVDLVVTDVNLPGEMDGFALARWIRDNRPGVEVIIQTGTDADPPEDLKRFRPGSAEAVYWTRAARSGENRTV